MNKLKHILLYGILCLGCHLHAQPLLKRLPSYPCVHYEKNELHFPAGKQSMQQFYAKMDTLLLFGKGNINLLHIGGSHVQADFLTNRIRTDLSNFQPGNQAERGFLYPYSVAKSNNPRNYSISTTGTWLAQQNSRPSKGLAMGIMGVAAQTADTAASISFALNSNQAPLRWTFNQLSVLGYASDTATYPLLIVQGDTLRPQADTLAATYNFRMPRQTDHATLRFHLADSSSTFTLTGLLPHNGKTGISYYSVGVNGASLSSWLRCTNFERDLQLVHPDMVVLGIGINDAAVPYGSFSPEEFKQHYRSLLAQIRRVSPQCTFVFMTNNDSFRRISRRQTAPNRNGVLVQQAFYELAKEYNAAVWDVFDLMGGLGSATAWQIAGLMQRDRLHFTAQGYELLGDMFFNALMNDYLGYNVTKL